MRIFQKSMRPLKFLILTILLVSCNDKYGDSKLFKDLTDKTEVTIVLKAYGLDSVPKEIGRLTNAKTMTLTLDSLKGWTVYPPLSAVEGSVDYPPFKTLPDDISELRNLERLIVYKLNITKLPDNFGDLSNLEYLDLSMNKLTVSNEISKLKKLKKLKYLGLFGNRIDTLTIINWEKENPDLQIDYKIK